MNQIELNAILYYADYLSLKETNHPVTDNCKYFYIHGAPINSLFILDLMPIYDEEDPYFKQASAEYTIIKNKFGEEGIESFIEDICSIRACGSVDAIRMLQCIHQYSGKYEKKQALKAYNTWKSNQYYQHIITNDDGKRTEEPCTKYVYHVERMLERRELAQRLRNNQERH